MSVLKPVLGITMGDATGCGPEIIVKSLMEAQFYEMSRPFVIGDAKIMERAVKIVGASAQVRKITSLTDAGNVFGVIAMFLGAIDALLLLRVQLKTQKLFFELRIRSVRIS